MTEQTEKVSKGVDATVVAALIAGVASLIVGGFSLLSAYNNNENARALQTQAQESARVLQEKSDAHALAIQRLQDDQKKREEETKHQKEMSYYREPLARSTFELRNRFSNILHAIL